MAKIKLALALLAIVIVGQIGHASAHHNPAGVLPGIPTWLIRANLWTRGEVTWCVDQRASTYPNFVNQLRQVTDAAYFASHIPAREVPGVFMTADGALTAGCAVWHTMPDELMDAGVAGQIWYANRPVQIKYNWRLGYRDFRSTQGHEGTNCGHAMGEHEAYDDINFVSYHNTYGGWASPWNTLTVMDFGTGIWECQPSDVGLIWSWLLPNPVREAGIILETSPPTLYYCGADPKANRVAVMAMAPNGGYYWSGIHLSSSDACVNVPLYSEPGWEFFFNTEIGPWEESWLWWEMRNDASAGIRP